MTESATQGTPRETVFDVDVERLAHVYAQAALDAAGDDEDGLMDELRSLLTDVLDKFPTVEEVFASALVSEDEKLGMLDKVFGSRMSTTGLSFLKIMAKHGRLGYLRPVIRSAEQLWSHRNGRVPVELELASEVDSGLQSEIVDSLRKSLGIEPVVTTKVDPDLIAGFVVRVGDKVYDASTRSHLERTRHAIVEQAVDAIQSQPQRFMNNQD